MLVCVKLDWEQNLNGIQLRAPEIELRIVAVIDQGTLVHSIGESIVSDTDKKRIQSTDPRCAWIFAEAKKLTGKDSRTLEEAILAIEEQPATHKEADFLAHVRDYLEYLSSLSLEDEIEDLLFAIDLDADSVELVIEEFGLLAKQPEPNRSGADLPVEVRRTLLTCKGAYCPTTFAYVRQYPGLFVGAISPLPRQNDSSQSSVLEVSLEQANALRKFFGIRHKEPVVPITQVPPVKAPEGAQTQATATTTGELSGGNKSSENPLYSVSEEDLKLGEPLSGSTLPRAIESEHVRAKIQEIIETHDLRLGVISTSEVISKAKESGIHLTVEGLESMVGRLDGIVWLDQNWLGRIHTSERGKRLIAEEEAAKILSLLDSIPIDILHAQLGRVNITFQKLSTDSIMRYFDSHSNFTVNNNSVRPGKFVRYIAGNETIPVELSMWRSMSNVAVGLTSEGVSRHYIGRAKLKDGPRNRILQSSSLFVKLDEGYYALTKSEQLIENIRIQTEYIDPLQHFATVLESVDELDVNDEDEDLDEVIEPPISSPLTVETTTAPIMQEVKPETPRHFGETRTTLLTLRKLLEGVTNNELVIPEIQRSYVWKTPQVRDLFDSLYNGYPVGTLLVWETNERLKGKRLGSATYFDTPSDKPVRFLLDGQQRITSILNAVEGRGLRLYFNAIDEHGSFRSSSAQLGYSLRSIPVAGLDRETVDSILSKAKAKQHEIDNPVIRRKLEHLVGILGRTISIDTLHGFDYGEATDVFIRVNSRGTKLKNAELALANLAYRLPGTVGSELQQYSDELASRGWDFSVPYLIRLITAVAARRVSYSALNGVDDASILKTWDSVKRATDGWLNVLATDLGILTETVLVGKNSHIVPIAWLALHENATPSHRLLYWFLLSNTFSRYTSTTDSNLDQDLGHIDSIDEKTLLEHLLTPIRQRRSTLRVEPLDVERAGAQSSLRILAYVAQLHLAQSNLFAPEMEAGTQQPPIAAAIWMPRDLKQLGFEPGDKWSKNGGLVNTIYVDPSYDGTDILESAMQLRSEARYQHALPVISFYRNNDQVQEFFTQRSRLMLQQMNDVLIALEMNMLNIRKVESPQLPVGRSRRELDYTNLPFDHIRRTMYDAIRRRILEIDSSVSEYETGVYIGFVARNSSRPFVSIAKRKSVLSFTVDCSVEEIRNPRIAIRDVSDLGKHGIGNTGFTINRANQLPGAVEIVEQVMDLRV